MLSGDCRAWKSTMRGPSSGRIGRTRAVPPSESTTSASHSAGYPDGMGTSLVVVSGEASSTRWSVTVGPGPRGEPLVPALWGIPPYRPRVGRRGHTAARPSSPAPPGGANGGTTIEESW